MVLTYQPEFSQYEWIQVQVKLTDEERKKPLNAVRRLAIERATEEMESRGYTPMTRPALVDRHRLIIGARWKETHDGARDASGDDPVPAGGGTPADS